MGLIQLYKALWFDIAAPELDSNLPPSSHLVYNKPLDLQKRTNYQHWKEIAQWHFVICLVLIVMGIEYIKNKICRSK